MGLWQVWNDLMDAIRNDKPYNEVERGVTVSVVTSMGRMAAHTGQEITFEDMLNCEHEFAPGLDKLTSDSPAPLQPAAVTVPLAVARTGSPLSPRKSNPVCMAGARMNGSMRMP